MTVQPRSLVAWSQPPADLHLPEGEIHLWMADLRMPAAELATFQTWLSDEERLRAGEFRSQTDRMRFIARRGLLRLLLSRYNRRDPVEIEFASTAWNKPVLVDSHLHFNLSSSGDWCLVGVSRSDPLGVDLELEKDFAEMQAVVDRFFSPAERDSWANLAPEKKMAGFYHGWTQKEAFIKALGDGMAFPSQDVDVVVNPVASGVILQIRGGAPEGWSVWTDMPFAGCFAAMAVERQSPVVVTYTYSGL